MFDPLLWAREGEERYCPLLLSLYRVSHLLGATWYISVWAQEKAPGILLRLPSFDQGSEGSYASLIRHCDLQGGTTLAFREFGLFHLLASVLVNAGSVKQFCSHLWALCSANNGGLGCSCWQSGLVTMAGYFSKQCMSITLPRLLLSRAAMQTVIRMCSRSSPQRGTCIRMNLAQQHGHDSDVFIPPRKQAN